MTAIRIQQRPPGAGEQVTEVKNAASLLVYAFIVQYVGLLAERWYFYAQARHPEKSTLIYPRRTHS